MANLQKNFLNEAYLVYPPCTLFDEELLPTELNDASKFFQGVDNTLEFNNCVQENNAIKGTPETRVIGGNSGLQPSLQQQEIGIHIPFYFENNNVYFRNPFVQSEQQTNHCPQEQHNNMVLPEVLEPQPPKTILANDQYDQNEWQIVPPNTQIPVNAVNGIYQHPLFSQMFLDGQYSNIIESTQTTLPPSTPFNSFASQYNFNYTNPRRHPFPSVPLYESESQSQMKSNSLVSPLCNQKPPVYTKWTEEEDDLLRRAINMYGPHKWSLIAAHVPNRTPMQCSTRWLGALNPTIHKGRWTPEEDAALKDAVSEYVNIIDSDGHPQPIPWNKVASRIPHRTGIQCQARWSEALDPTVRKGKWSPDEDEALKDGVRRYGRCWIRIAELIEGRTQRQCRTRWVQIRNKQAKIERDAKAATIPMSATISTDDCDEMLTPPRTTPSTPAQPINLHDFLSMNHMNTLSLAIQPNSPTKNKSPNLSPSETSATESCVTTPDSDTFE